MSEFLSWLRDAFTVCFFAGGMLYMATYEFRQEMRELFAKKNAKDAAAPAAKAVKRVKFNGSAATWVK